MALINRRCQGALDALAETEAVYEKALLARHNVRLKTIQTLRREGLPVTRVSELIGVSTQRIHQLELEGPRRATR